MQKFKHSFNCVINYLRRDWSGILLWLIISLLIVFCVNIFLLQSFRVVSGSMMPTLYEDDILLVSKWSYGYSRSSLPPWLAAWIPDIDRFLVFSKPKRGDIIIFTDRELTTVYVKRVIGVPGDKIQIIDGQVWINDQVLKQEIYSEKLIQVLQNNNIKLPRLSHLPAHITTDNIRLESISDNLQHYIIDQVFSVLDNTDTFVLPANRYFVMGDNRDNSSDSRIPVPRGLGLINFRHIVGKVLWLRRSIWPQTWHNVNINHGK